MDEYTTKPIVRANLYKLLSHYLGSNETQEVPQTIEVETTKTENVNVRVYYSKVILAAVILHGKICLCLLQWQA